MLGDRKTPRRNRSLGRWLLDVGTFGAGIAVVIASFVVSEPEAADPPEAVQRAVAAPPGSEDLS